MSEMELIAHMGFDRPKNPGDAAPNMRTQKQRCYKWREKLQQSRKLQKLPLNRYYVAEVETLSGKPVKLN